MAMYSVVDLRIYCEDALSRSTSAKKRTICHSAQ